VRRLERKAGQPVVPEAAPARPGRAGRLTVTSPVELRIVVGGRFLGTTGFDGLSLPPGRHSLDLINETIGYRETRSILVSPGESVSMKVGMPDGVIAINAMPWADVWVDGRFAGQTPIGRLTVPAGTHTIRFRHPRLGERTVTTLVRADEPRRVGIDLR
jgi:hypothetical protein